MQSNSASLSRPSVPTGVARTAIRRLLASLLGLACIAALIYLRDPRYFTQPRFWAEEGMLHFAFSYNHGGLAALFQPQIGYLNFWPNLATLLANLAPLESAPLVTTLMALLVQLLPVALIFWSRSPLWQGWWRKALGAAICLFVALTNEVWLNTVNSFTFFAVIVFLILVEAAPASRPRQWIYRLILVFGGLTGTMACFLTPLFFVQAWLEKKGERLLQASILTADCLVQIGIIFSIHASGSIGQRFQPIGLTTLGNTIWLQSLGLIAVGLDRAHEFGMYLLDLMKTSPSFYQWLGRGLLILAIVILFALSANLPRRLRWIFLTSYGLILVLTLSFSIISEKYTFYNTGLHQRLFLAPNILLGWMLLANAGYPKSKSAPPATHWAWLTTVSGVLAGLLLASALFWGMKSYSGAWVAESDWPDWRREVQAWRADPSHPLEIQPAGQGWVVQLNRH
jgi:hypothetical protein